MPADKLDSLIKFTDREGAVRILTDGTLRWSSPDRFGDPFELSSNSELNFDSASLLDSTIKLASSMIFAPEQPKGDSPLINAIRRWREENRFASAEEAHGVLRELLSKMVDHRRIQLEAALVQWQEYVRELRICTFSAKPDNITAWDQFADLHRGVAIRFHVDDTEPFASAKPVLYQTERPQLTSLREQLGAILHNRKDAVVERFKDHFLIKGVHRKLEQELRCLKRGDAALTRERAQPQDWYEDLPFRAEQVSGIFFGLCTDAATKARIISLVQEHYSHAKLFQAIPGKVGYTLEFEKISNKA